MLCSKLNYYLIIFLVLLCSSNIEAQVEGNLRAKIDSLKSSPDYNSQSKAYIDLLIDLAQIKLHSDTTLIILKEVHDLSAISKYHIGETKALKLYGAYYLSRSENKKGNEYNFKALEVANTHKLYIEKIKLLNNIGLNYSKQEDEEKALIKYLEALNLAKKYKKNKLISILNHNIAVLYNANGDYDTALIFYKKAREYSIHNKNLKFSGVVLMNMAKIYILKEKFTEAENFINQSIQIFKKINSKLQLSAAYRRKGELYFEKKEYKEVLKWFLKSEELCDELNYDRGRLFTYKGLGATYLKFQNFDAAEKYGMKALQVSKKISDLRAIEKLNLLLSQIYHEKGADKKAYEYLTQYNQQYSKRTKEGFKKGLGMLRSKMKFENQKKILIEENNKALAKQKQYVYFTLGALLIVTLFLILIFRTHKIQKKFTAELSDSNKTKDKLFSVIAHDLKGPINSFYSLMKLYMDKEFNKEDTAHLFPKAMDDIHNISDMLNNLLLWAKTQMQGTTIKQENIDINKIASDNVLLLNPLAEKKHIKINNNIAEDTLSFSDRDHIDIVLRNLISNAIKFTNSNGEININAIQLNNELQIEVSDNGVGMDLETQSNLFAKNNTKSTYGTNNEKGTGLGLSLCRDMVESNCGEIWVSSIKDKGTSIFFTMPTKEKCSKAM